MPEVLESPAASFIDRRSSEAYPPSLNVERRQFANSHEELTPDARELAGAIDGYKLRHRRRLADRL